MARRIGESLPYPLISVIVGTYNGERYIAEQLASIYAQTYRPLEVLISDDGSSDSTMEIAAGVNARGVPVQTHRNAQNEGFADNFLLAVERAHGTYVAFSDQDDIWYPQKLEVQLAAIRRTGASAATHDTHYIDEVGQRIPHKGSRTGRRLVRRDESTLEPWGNFLGNTLLIERGLFAAIPRSARGAGPVPGEHLISHDRWAFALAGMAQGIALVPAALSAYRQHASQLYGVRLVKPRGGTVTRVDRVVRANEADRLAALADHRLALLRRGAPARDTARSARRWRSVAAAQRRSAAYYRANGPLAALRLAGKALLGDFRPSRWGGYGWRGLRAHLM